MSIVVPRVSLIVEAQQHVVYTLSAKVKLFKNDIEPDEDTVLGDMEECDFDDYGLQSLNADPVIASALDGEGRLWTTWNELTWTKGAGMTSNNVYGYYVVSSDGLFLFWVERFPGAPVPMSILGEMIRFTPRYSRKSAA